MKILIVSFYYPPDLSAGSFRVKALVGALREQASRDLQIHVITTLPNRYKSFSAEAPAVETDGTLKVERIQIPSHRSDMLQQGRAFLSFARKAARIAGRDRYDLIFATSSRLMTAALGAYLARKQRARLYLDIRDIFVDTIRDVLPRSLAVPARWFSAVIERLTMRQADRINLVSPGFEGYFRSRYPRQSLSWFTNGIDEEFLELPAHAPIARVGLPTILYAGNIGASQALHEVLPDMAAALRGRANFVVIGDGGRIDALTSAVRDRELDNVEIRPPVQRANLIHTYQQAQVLFLHLGAVPAFEKVLPSKVFEYAALGKPILAGVGGYAARFIREEIDNAAVFPPCDAAAGVAAACDSLQLTDRPRAAFVAKFSRAAIMHRMAQDVLSCVGERQK
jgi:glycosyltransferase involved in cell wall biosynthesis